MKVIPSAMVSSKFFSVSANTAPCRGGKASEPHHGGYAYSTVAQNYLHNLHTTQTGRAVASEGQRLITGPVDPEPMRRLEEVAGQCSARSPLPPPQPRVGRSVDQSALGAQGLNQTSLPRSLPH